MLLILSPCERLRQVHIRASVKNNIVFYNGAVVGSESAASEAEVAASENLGGGVSAEQAEAFEKSLTMIEDSRSMGVWDNEMRDQFRTLLQQVHPDEQEELILSVIQAMNNGEIVSEADGLPFF